MAARTANSLASLLDFAHLLADRSEPAILRQFRRRIAIEDKGKAGDYDPVTAADRDAETLISKLISKHFPEHGLVGEEFGSRNASARYRWVIDPIDGTRAFIMGQPLWGTLIGLLNGDQPLLGVMNQPFTGERFWGGPKGAFFRMRGGPTRRLVARDDGAMTASILSTTHPDLIQGRAALAFGRLAAEVRMTRFGGDCYNFCLVAAGHIDLVVECGLKPHDIVALIPIIEGAGGVVTTWDGRPATGGGDVIAAGNRRLHAQALKLLGT